MAKFQKFDPREHMYGLARAAEDLRLSWRFEEERNFQECMDFFREKAHETRMEAEAEELIRTGRMPSFEQLQSVIAETRAKYQAKILAARNARKPEQPCQEVVVRQK